MENRIQHFLLTAICASVLSVAVSADEAESFDADRVNSEFFELGVFAGLLNVQDFTTNPVLGVSASFNASEDVFLQFNWAQSDVAQSSYEKAEQGGSFFTGDDRNYQYYDFLVGYNLLQGEVFSAPGQANWSALYLVGGVGNTDFGGESSFTYTVGVGYKVTFARRYVWKLDLRDHSYRSSLIAEDDRTHNLELSTGISYLF